MTELTVNYSNEQNITEDSPAQLALAVIFQEQQQRFAVDPDRQIIQLHDHFAEPNLWLNRTGFDQHLSGLNMMDLYNVTSNGLSDDEYPIQRILARVEAITNSAIDFARGIDRSNFALFEVRRIDHRPAIKPFNLNLHQETWEKYKRTMQKNYDGDFPFGIR